MLCMRTDIIPISPALNLSLTRTFHSVFVLPWIKVLCSQAKATSRVPQREQFSAPQLTRVGNIPSQGAKILLTISSTFLAKLPLPDGAWLVKGVLACVNNASLALHSLDNICKRCSTASLRVLTDSLFIQRQPQTKIRTTDRRDGRVEGNKSMKRHLKDCLGSSSAAWLSSILSHGSKFCPL